MFDSLRPSLFVLVLAFVCLSVVTQLVKTIVVGGTLELLPKLYERKKKTSTSGYFAEVSNASIVKKWWFEVSEEAGELSLVREVCKECVFVCCFLFAFACLFLLHACRTVYCYWCARYA